MTFETVVGLVAATLTTGAYLPQAIKVIRTRNASDLSMSMYITMNIGVLLWLVYGLMQNSLPIILANTITACLTSIILFIIIRHK